MGKYNSKINLSVNGKDRNHPDMQDAKIIFL